jgi:aconitate hydratase
MLQDLTRTGATLDLLAAGARLHQAGCLGCIGMGQAPAAGRNSLRTFPRNFPGRSGTEDDAVWLCSPETATASALTGAITDPRDWAAAHAVPHPRLNLPEHATVNTAMLEPPPPPDEAAGVRLERGPNISALPELDALPDSLDVPVLFKAGDHVSTDEISPAGARALPYRSNIPKLAEFTLTRLDPDFPHHAAELRDQGGHIIVAGENWGQGSSREHAALTLRYLGLRALIAQTYARIHWQNLANFGVLPLEFDDPADLDRIRPGDRLRLENLHAALAPEAPPSLTAHNITRSENYRLHHRLSARQRQAVLAGGTIPALAGAKR